MPTPFCRYYRSEFINYTVTKLLGKLLIEQTKSRPHRSGDNGLVEAKNGAVIRKHLGFGHIGVQHATGYWYSTRSTWFIHLLERFPIPAAIRALDRETFIAEAWKVAGRKVDKRTKLEEITNWPARVSDFGWRSTLRRSKLSACNGPAMPN
jgi:hypothetical protein